VKTKEAELKEKERQERIKELRRDIQQKLEDQLPPEMLDPKIRVEVERADEAVAMDEVRAKQVIEALLFASSKPLSVPEIRKVAKALTPRQIQTAMEALAEEYRASGRSFEICEIAGGYELSTKKEFAPWIVKIELQKKARQASQSALESLAILAYRQPMTRAEMEDLRGVDSSAVLNGLFEKGFVKIVGKKEIPGRPFLYATTEKFLEHFGLKSLEELPNIEEIRTLVEQSVKKDELLGTPKIVDVPSEAGTAVPPAAEAPDGPSYGTAGTEGLDVPGQGTQGVRPAPSFEPEEIIIPDVPELIEDFKKESRESPKAENHEAP